MWAIWRQLVDRLTMTALAESLWNPDVLWEEMRRRYLKAAYGRHAAFADEYLEKTDHIGPFSIDDWILDMGNKAESQVDIRVGILPFEILTDKARVTI